MNENYDNNIIEETGSVQDGIPAGAAESVRDSAPAEETVPVQSGTPAEEMIPEPDADAEPEDDFSPIIMFESDDEPEQEEEPEPVIAAAPVSVSAPGNAGARVRPIKHKKAGGLISHNLIIAVLAAVWLIPIVWLVCTSFSAYDGMNTSTFFPKEWSAEHYRRLFESDSVNQFSQWFMNTLKIAIATCVISTMFTLMVAYATSFGKFKARKPLMNFAVILNLFPGVLSMIAVYFVLKTFGLTNSHIGLVLVYSGSSGLGYLICKGFFDTLPRVLCEAARIDGCSEARTFFQIIMPMSKPIIVYTVISSFLGPWMDFVFAKMILNAGVSQYYTVAVGLYKMLDKSLINSYFTIFCCGGVFVAVPISILFFIMQKFYVEGITGGSVKG